MYTQLEDINNRVAQEKISSDRLRNEQIRRKMQDDWSAPVEGTTASPTGDQPVSLTDVTKTPTGTLASIYSGLKGNQDQLSNMLNGGSTPQSRPSSSTYGDNSGYDSNTFSSSDSTGKMPGWAPGVASNAARILGAGQYSGLAGIATNLFSGNYEKALQGAEGWGLNTALSKTALSKTPGLTGLFTTLGQGLLGDKDTATIGKDLVNQGIGTVASMINPAFGTVYGLARLFGFDPVQGVIDHSMSDYSQRDAAGYNGGFWSGFGNRGSWNATSGETGTNNTYSGSGVGNVAGPGSTYKGEPTVTPTPEPAPVPIVDDSYYYGDNMNADNGNGGLSSLYSSYYGNGGNYNSGMGSNTYGGLNTGVGSGFNSAGWGSYSSSSSDSGGD